MRKYTWEEIYRIWTDRLTGEITDIVSGMFEKSHELEEEIQRKLGAIGYEI